MADPRKDTPITPEDLRENLSTFDPKAVAEAAKPQTSPDQGPDESGPPPGGTAEQARRDQKQSVFNNNPERDRDDHLVNVGRGQQTHG
jgi:hypothetical protein